MKMKYGIYFFTIDLLFITHDKRGAKMKLGNISTVRSGLVLSRKKADAPSEYSYWLLNLRSVKSEGYIDMEQVEIYNAVEPLKSEYISRPGDIIVRLSVPYTAVLVDESTSGMVISSNFVIIRTNSDYILPEYLFWLLNTSKERHKIFENATSNMLGAVKAKYFNDYEITPIPLSEQKRISELNILSQRESRLLEKLAKEKRKYYSGLIDKIQKEMKRGK